MNTETVNHYTASKDLNNFIDELKDNGFRVITHDNNSTWAIFEKDNKLGYVQIESLTGCFSFSSVHKPCQACGTGYSIDSEVVNPTIQNALDSFAFAPTWAMASQLKEIEKYKSIEEYIGAETILKYHEV